MSKTALVTGGAGFIGSHLCERLLDNGWHVTALDNFSTGSHENVHRDVVVVDADIADAQACARACARVDTVFHLAARVAVRQSVRSFVDDARTNLMGTLHVLRAAGSAGVRRFVFASSMAVYADAPDPAPVDEAHPAEPLSPYGIGKLAAEKYVLTMGPALGLEPVVLRVFNTYGPRQRYSPYVGVVTIFVTRIAQGKRCTIFGDGEQRRDFVHVHDVADAFVLAADAPMARGEVINIGSGVVTSVNQLAALVREVLGRGEFAHEPPHPAELRYSVADIAKASALLAYHPRRTLGDEIQHVVQNVLDDLANGHAEADRPGQC